MGVLARCELLLQAKNYSGSGAWLDEANSHDAQFGSLSGADTNDPLFHDYTGMQFVYMSGVTGNYASTPDAAALDIVGDIDIQVLVALDDWTSTSQILMGKFDEASSQITFRFINDSNNNLQFDWSTDGAVGTLVQKASTTSASLNDGDRQWLRATLDVSSGDLKFFTGGSADTPSWSQLGNTVTNSATSIHAGTAELRVGDAVNPTLLSQGEFYQARVYDGIDGTLVFDANFTNQTALTEPYATFTEGSSNAATVTFNRSTTGRKLTVVNQPVMLLGTDDYFEVPDHADLDVTASDAFTLMVWARLYDTSPDEDQILVGKKDDLTTSAGYTLYVESADATAKFLIADGTADDEDPTANLTVGQAFVITGVKNETDDDIESFLDGTGGSAVTDSTTNTLANALTFNIGASSNATPANYFDGEIFAVAFWNEALSDADVTAAGLELQANSGSLLLLGVG